jgi:hypothetical protein
MITAYRDTDRAAGHRTMSTLIDALSGGVPAALTELITLGRTLKRRAADVLAYFTRPGTSNGPTEAINGRLEHLRGSALGFRNLTNYIARSLLEAGGFRPRLHPRLEPHRRDVRGRFLGRCLGVPRRRPGALDRAGMARRSQGAVCRRHKPQSGRRGRPGPSTSSQVSRATDWVRKRLYGQECGSAIAQMHCVARASSPDSASRLMGSGSGGWKESRTLPAWGPVSKV